MILPDVFLAVDYMLDRFAWLIRGLVVRPERMRENLRRGGGVHFSQRLLLALVERGAPRDEAYGLVQRITARAWDEGADFQTLAESDPDVGKRLTPDARRAVFDLGAYTRHVDTVFDRLSVLESELKEEPVHV